MSAQTKPRAADVARWVATLAATSPVNIPSRDAARRRKVKARAALTAAGLDAQGNPKPAPVAYLRAALAIAARDALRRLAREQGYALLGITAEHLTALATDRTEAARAAGGIAVALAQSGRPISDVDVSAWGQWAILDGSGAAAARVAIPTDTLTAWSDGWDAFAASLGCAYTSTSGVCGEPVAAGATRCPRHT